MDFLSENGLSIYKELKKHCESKLKLLEVDRFELAMLANSFDLYAKAAKYCRDYGISMSFKPSDAPEDYEDLADDEKETVRESKSSKAGGIYQQIRPEYTVMKNEYNNILKHAGKFGINPADRSKFFKGIDKPQKKKITDDLD